MPTHTINMNTLCKKCGILPFLTIFFALIIIIATGGLPMSQKVFAIDEETEAYRLISHFSTYYGDSKQNRKDNIALAARKIDGVVLYPEDEFSFNDMVGRRTVENGFKTAYVIQDGDFVEGVGGGVCQVSSTLYNCALLANLAITNVRAHSLPVSYVAPSFDAMVSSQSDLCFVNTLSSPITVRMSANGKYLRAEIYGIDKFEIKRRSMTIGSIPFDVEYREDATIELGKEIIDTYGKEGLKSQGYLDYYENGKLAKSVLIRTDCYSPQKRIVLKGTKTSSLTDAPK